MRGGVGLGVCGAGVLLCFVGWHDWQVGVEATYISVLHCSIRLLLFDSNWYNLNEGFDSYLWLKVVPLKVNLFVWRLFMNKLPTKDNLYRRDVIDASHLTCAALCGELEDRDHLFFCCDVYGRIWLLVSKWLGIDSVYNDTISTHSS